MLAIISVILPVMLALHNGGNLKNILNFNINKLWIAIVSVVVYTASFILNSRDIIDAGTIQVLGMTIMVLSFYFNRQHRGMAIIMVGSMLNILVMAANGCKMPVDVSLLDSSINKGLIDSITTGINQKYTELTDNTNLSMLSDIIKFPNGLGNITNIFSVGDLLMIVGLAILVYGVVRGTQRSGEKNAM